VREIDGDLFAYDDADAIVIPTNTETVRTREGLTHAVMGAGIAKVAADRWETLPIALAARMAAHGKEHVYAFDLYFGSASVVCLPTKRDWRKPSDIDLIWRMVDELKIVTRTMGWESVALPRLGCGRGGLDWETQVRRVLVELLDDRFIVVHR
jgi:O-acetyl-ADP-ribose deacetylase (regulator of RNase III)